MAASMALPPFRSAATPASVACGCTDATMPFVEDAALGGKPAANVIEVSSVKAVSITDFTDDSREPKKWRQMSPPAASIYQLWDRPEAYPTALRIQLHLLIRPNINPHVYVRRAAEVEHERR